MVFDLVGPSTGRRWLELERAMGIEPTRAARPALENKRFGTNAEAKCDWRVNFRGMWGNVGLRRSVSMREVSVAEPHCRSPIGP